MEPEECRIKIEKIQGEVVKSSVHILKKALNDKHINVYYCKYCKSILA